MTDTVAWGVFYDRVVAFPLRVTEGSIATLIFAVDADLVAPRLPGRDFTLARTADGAAQLVVSVGDYRRTDWTACRQFIIGFLVAPIHAPAEVGIFTHRMPVDEVLTCAVGHGAMDYPVSIELITASYSADHATFRLAVGVEPTLCLQLPRAGTPLASARRARIPVYSYRAGVPYVMPVEMDRLAPVASDDPALSLTLGSGLLADELRQLRLPALPLFCGWSEGITATFHAPTPLSPEDDRPGLT